MFMQRIEIPVVTEAKPKRRGLKLAVGLLFLLAAVTVVVPWTVALALCVVVVVAARAVAKAASFVHDTLLYAGELVVGR